MRTEICDQLGIEFPIFAFTHCRDVVAAVSNAGGLGVLGAVGFSAEQLATELAWIDEHTDKPYGVDIVIPGKYEGMGELDPEKLEKDLSEMIPEEHREFARKILADHGVPEMPDDEVAPALLGWTEATARPLVEEALRHDKVKLIANALGTPPPEIIDEIHDAGRLVAALCGSASQAVRHRNAGVDIVIAQGSEGGGHTGDVGSMVLWPEVIDAVAPTPGARRGRHRLRPPDGGRAGPGRRRRVDRLAVAHRRGGRRAAHADGELPRGHQPRHRALPQLRPASRAGCCATTGPRPGRPRTRPTRWACRCSSWSPARPWPGATTTRSRPWT